MKRSNRLSYSPVNLQDFTGETRKIRIEGAPGSVFPLDRVQRPGLMVAVPAESETSMLLRELDASSISAFNVLEH